MTLTHSQGVAQGQARKLAGMTAAALNKQRRIVEAQLAMLEAGLGRPDRTCSADDIPGDRAVEYDDGGKWVGPAVQGLSTKGIIVKVGYDTSARPSRHGGDLRVWGIKDDLLALNFARDARQWLGVNPPPIPEGATLFDLTPRENSGPAATPRAEVWRAEGPS